MIEMKAGGNGDHDITALWTIMNIHNDMMHYEPIYLHISHLAESWFQ